MTGRKFAIMSVSTAETKLWPKIHHTRSVPGWSELVEYRSILSSCSCMMPYVELCMLCSMFHTHQFDLLVTFAELALFLSHLRFCRAILIWYFCRSVSPSVRQTRHRTASKRLYISSTISRHLVGTSFYFILSKRYYKIPTVTPILNGGGALNADGIRDICIHITAKTEVRSVVCWSARRRKSDCDFREPVSDVETRRYWTLMADVGKRKACSANSSDVVPVDVACWRFQLLTLCSLRLVSSTSSYKWHSTIFKSFSQRV